MLRNIRIRIEYDGTAYCGWQLQPDAQTIQGELEKAIASVVGQEVRIIGSGRTDAGVHALSQMANFKSETGIGIEQISAAINHFLPPDIVVHEAEEMPLEFHSQYAAKTKTYRYLICNSKHRPALNRHRWAWVRYELDFESMLAASEIFKGTHDFKSFASESKDKDTVRIVSRLDITKSEPLITLEISANGFLYNMVRSIVGTLIDVGRNHISVEEVAEMLEAKDREKGGPVAPACGLYLVGVNY
ncbi:MAG: tRNA pseudouridine(38-40) synthase TruA [Planctomycetota bacterium]|nr:tRNA pseudouridine(38-40) synthase TruA [Planctomycetota bacterium]MDA1138092.1 tRNA pseudouridine(38-40) synthase TruA [Planctomycetota bacterium]